MDPKQLKYKTLWKKAHDRPQKATEKLEKTINQKLVAQSYNN